MDSSEVTREVSAMITQLTQALELKKTAEKQQQQHRKSGQPASEEGDDLAPGDQKDRMREQARLSCCMKGSVSLFFTRS